MIQIASVTSTETITTNDGKVTENTDGSYNLAKGTYSAQVDLTKDITEKDEFGVASRLVYLVITVSRADDTTEIYYITVDYTCDSVTREITIGDASVDISFGISWVKPGSPAANHLEANKLEIGVTQSASVTEDSTETSTESQTEATTGTTTEPSAETTSITETVTESTEGTTETTEETTESAGETDQSASE